MKAVFAFLLLATGITHAAGNRTPTQTPASWVQPAPDAWPEVFLWKDTCNVYALRNRDAAVLLNLGDGDALEHLQEIGVKRVEWVLFTDHHRELHQGIGRLDRKQTQVAASKEEAELLETPNQFRKWRPTLGDKFTVHGASYVRPPAAPIHVDRALAADDAFLWRGHEITCMGTPGHSPGGMSFVLRKGDRACAFTGGLMHDGSRMSNWFDTEWDYGFAKGLDALLGSVEKVNGLNLDWAFPSQGPAIRDAHGQFQRYATKLAAFRPDYLRGYPVQNLTERKPDPFEKPTAIPQIVQVTPHLYKFSDLLAGKNFTIIIADSGRGLLLDCGIFPEGLLHSLIQQMKTHLGLKRIDAVWISHMHGDHFTLAAALKKHYGVKTWTLDRIVDPIENPTRYDYCALITSYRPEYEGLKIDRPIRDGEVIDWEGYKLHVDWMPGQTEFGNCLWLELDGKRIAFTGDNLFGDPSDPAQNGHEAVVARNSAIFEEGYFLGSRYLRDLKPDIVSGAHSVLMPNPAAFLQRYHEWSKRIIAHYRELLPDPNYEYLFDPFWVRAYPYRVDLAVEETQTVQITVRNFRDRVQRHRIELKLPPGIEAEPKVLEGSVAAMSRQAFDVKLTVKDRAALGAGVQIVPFDIALDGKRYGELFDFLVLGRTEKP